MLWKCLGRRRISFLIQICNLCNCTIHARKCVNYLRSNLMTSKNKTGNQCWMAYHVARRPHWYTLLWHVIARYIYIKNSNRIKMATPALRPIHDFWIGWHKSKPAFQNHGRVTTFRTEMYNKKSIHFQMQIRYTIWPCSLGPQCEWNIHIAWISVRWTRLQRTIYCRPLKAETPIKELL